MIRQAWFWGVVVYSIFLALQLGGLIYFWEFHRTSGRIFESTYFDIPAWSLMCVGFFPWTLTWFILGKRSYWSGAMSWQMVLVGAISAFVTMECVMGFLWPEFFTCQLVDYNPPDNVFGRIINAHDTFGHLIIPVTLLIVFPPVMIKCLKRIMH